MKQTAVEWLEKELIKRFKRNQMHYTDSEWCFDMIKKLSEQAKEMEKKKGYSEEEVLNKLTHFAVEIQRQNKQGIVPLRINEWFEQNKNK